MEKEPDQLKPADQANNATPGNKNNDGSAGDKIMSSAKAATTAKTDAKAENGSSSNGGKAKSPRPTPVKGVKAIREEPEVTQSEPEEVLPEQKSSGKAKEEVETPGLSFAPKTFLQPYMLLLLRDWSMHGYEVWERLMKMGFPGFDQNDRATVYRALRQLEREGKVSSEWDTKADGPARRVYRLTDAGEQFLKYWAGGLDQYRKTLDFFFKLYTGGMVPSPFSFNPLTGDDEKKNEN